ncbi:hypothetical protein PENFLA_c022G09590 [Penicillium flavigenum]|uniref:Uncharacterized protein n=1 Tax=Penicillium flavigenum TaxID=254877 RepID=A0A1V6SWK0_9EURO|nr:hypothetical protein PENFLA_c022G09590 [Penicillium flavigenum]
MEHIAQVSIQLPHLNPADMSVHDTSCAFGLQRSTEGYQPWQFPKVEIDLPKNFCELIPALWTSIFPMLIGSTLQPKQRPVFDIVVNTLSSPLDRVRSAADQPRWQGGNWQVPPYYATPATLT